MEICKDCIHFDVCRDATIPNPEYKGTVAEKSKECRHFKNKADFEEVKHGHWIGQYPKVPKCSVCSAIDSMQGNYCRYCGAKMDGERKL